MFRIWVNNDSYPARRISINLSPIEQDSILRKGRVVVSYDLSHDQVSKMVFILRKDDGIKKKMQTIWLKGQGVQTVDALMFDSIELDEYFENQNVDVSFNGYNLFKNE